MQERREVVSYRKISLNSGHSNLLHNWEANRRIKDNHIINIKLTQGKLSRLLILAFFLDFAWCKGGFLHQCFGKTYRSLFQAGTGSWHGTTTLSCIKSQTSESHLICIAAEAEVTHTMHIITALDWTCL
jgi:hypothetical protein